MDRQINNQDTKIRTHSANNKLPKVAIVSTVADCEKTIDFFIQYHLSIGFDHIFLFCDTTDDSVAKRVGQYKQVFVQRNGQELYQKWRITDTYRNFQKRALIDKEVMVRQEMNVEVAIQMARKAGFDWLLHIDSDELFYTQESSIKRHFYDLGQRGIGSIVYSNMEAIPEHFDIQHPFTEITLFKKNYFRQNLWAFNAGQREFINKSPRFDDKYFLFYQNGKSAVNLRYARGVDGVHYFLAAGKREQRSNKFPTVLHFPCSTFELFLEKYRRLGNFADEWLGKPRTGKFVSGFHLEARDVVNEDQVSALEFYNRRVVVNQASEVEQLLDLALAVRITDIPEKLCSIELHNQDINQALLAKELITLLRDQSYREGLSREFSNFKNNLDTRLPAIIQVLSQVYGSAEDFDEFIFKLIQKSFCHYCNSSPKMKGANSSSENNWTSDHQRIGACLYVDRFCDTLAGLEKRVDYLKSLGVNHLYLMPIFKTPNGSNDGGFAISSYREISPELGSMDDFRSLVRRLKETGFTLSLDFVLNHTASDHEWALAAKTGDEHYREFYHLFDEQREVEEYLANVQDTFPESGRDIIFHEELDCWVWSTFHHYQWDLNYSNPEVFAAMLDNLQFLACEGVDAFRFDAIPHIWKEKGSSCKNHPHCHAIVEAFCHLTKLIKPEVVFISEAIVAPEEVMEFVSPSRTSVAYRPLLAASLWQALAMRDTRAMSYSLARWSDLPSGCEWLSYVNCHDDLHWVFSNRTLLEFDPNFDFLEFYRQLLSFYRNPDNSSFARGKIFQKERISGSTASLVGLEKALENKDREAVEKSINRILLLHSVILSIGGLPLLYIGDEIGTLNDYSYLQYDELKDDSRWVHRPKKNWFRDRMQLSSPYSPATKIFSGIKKLIAARKSSQIFSGHSMRTMFSERPELFSFCRRSDRSRFIYFGNFTPSPTKINIQEIETYNLKGEWFDMIWQTELSLSDQIILQPYEYKWLIQHDGDL